MQGKLLFPRGHTGWCLRTSAASSSEEHGPGRSAGIPLGDLPGRDGRLGGGGSLPEAAVGYVHRARFWQAGSAANRPGALAHVPRNPPAGQIRAVCSAGGSGICSWRLPDILRVMDLQQEQLARSLGKGHRVDSVVARFRQDTDPWLPGRVLAKVCTKPILILCYNKALAKRLEHWMLDKGVADRLCAELSGMVPSPVDHL